MSKDNICPSPITGTVEQGDSKGKLASTCAFAGGK